MAVRSVYCIFICFMSLLTQNKENKTAELQIKDLKKQKDQKLHLDKNTKMYHLKDGSSPNSVLSAISGSLSPHALIFFIIFLLIQMCAGDEVNLAESSYLESDKGPEAHLLSSSSSVPDNYVITIVLAVLLAVSIWLNIFSFYFYCKMKRTVSANGHFPNPSYEAIPGAVGGSSQAEDPSPRPYIPVLRCTPGSDIVASLKEQKTETANFRDELLSRLRETEREKSENNEKLQSVESRLENGASNTNLELLKEKGKLLEIKWRLDNRKTDTETVLLYTDKLLQKINNVTDTMSGQ